jgi:peptidoglycan/xylan/chitin deacetylase (PgdA/CDA1 family)
MRHIRTLLFGALAALICASSTPAARGDNSPAPLGFVAFPQKQVLVLMYHQVTNTPEGVSAGEGHYGPAVSPQQFDTDLSYLKSRGFQPVDPLVALRYLDGRADASSLPKLPYIVTFDDGFVSAWTTATAILKRHNVKAMMFIEGIRTDRTPGRLTSQQISAMAGSGVWEIESHGYTGHWALQIGPKPTDLSPYWYANLAWLPSAGRLETPSEFEERLFQDFQKSRQTLEAMSGTQATTFAYPSGEYGQNVPLPPGANADVFAGEAGHSNAAGLTPHIEAALQRAGFRDAFAVIVPGTELAASPADAPYLFPRTGGSPQTYDPDVAVMTNGEMKLPAISPDYQWVDCRSVAAAPRSIWVAGGAAPYLYRLDALTGRIDDVVRVAALQDGRMGQPVLVAGLIEHTDGSLVAYQQKGWWDGGQARLVTFRIDNHTAVDVKSQPLGEDGAWFVGMAQADEQLIGMTEDGHFFAQDGTSWRQLFSLPDDAPGWKSNDVGRFAGLAFAHGLLYVADRKSAQLLGVDPATGALKESATLPKGVDVRAVGGDDQYLWLVDYSNDRRLIIRMRSTQGAPR